MLTSLLYAYQPLSNKAFPCVGPARGSIPIDPETVHDEVLHLTGYSSISYIIASDANYASAIYKRFDNLSARDLLYHQSELADLQAKQDQYGKEDADDLTTLSSIE